MADPITVSEFRRDAYRLVDRVIETGQPLVIRRRGGAVRLIAEDRPQSRLGRIRTDPNAVVGDPEDLVSIDWTHDWDPDRQLDP